MNERSIEMAGEQKNLDLELEDDIFEREKKETEPATEKTVKAPQNYVKEEAYYSEYQEVDPTVDETRRWQMLMQDYKSKRILEGFLYDVVPNYQQGRVDLKTEIRGFNVLIPDHQYFSERAFKEDFYKENEEEQIRRKMQKGRAALYSRLRFVIVGVDVIDHEDGEKEYVVIGSRKEAMNRIREEWRTGTKEHGPLKAGDVVDLSVISVGEHHAMLEGFGMECVLKYDRINAYKYIRSVSDELCVGNTVQVLIQNIHINEDGTYYIRVSGAALGRSEIERKNAELKKGASYTGVVLNHNITARKYTVIIKSKPARVTVNEDAVLDGVYLQRGDVVSVTITNSNNKNRNINYGTAKFIRNGFY